MSGVPISSPPRSGRTNSNSLSQQRNSIKQNTLLKINKQKKIVRHSRTGSNNSLSPISPGIKTNDSNNSLPPSPTSTTLLENVISLMQFPDYRNKVICPTCNSTGTICNKNGTTSRQTDPRPDQQFKCNNCKKFVTITQLRSLISTAINTLILPNTTNNNNSNSNNNKNNNNTNDDINSVMELDNHLSFSPPPQQQSNHFLLQKLSVLEKRLDSFQIILDENITMKAEIKRLTLIIESMQQKPADPIENEQKQTTTKIQKSTSIYNNNNNNINKEDDGDTDMLNVGEASSSGNTQLIDDYDQEFPAPPVSTIPQHDQQQQQPAKNKKNKTINYRTYKPTEKDLVLAQRTFQEKQVQDISNFIYTYVPVHRRFRSSELRKKLTLLGLDNVQILDAYCPDWKVAAILTHEKYQPQLIEAFSKAKILTSFYNHLDPIHIRDPKHQHLTTEQKLDLSKTIQNNNMMRALKHMRFTAKYSVARSFFRDGLITLTQLQETLKSRYTSDTTGFVTSVTLP